MHFRAYFFNSFLVHALLLVYLLSLPLHRPTFQFGSYGTYFVSIKSGTEMPAKILSPTSNVKKSKPATHRTLKDIKTSETDVSKDTINLQAKKETVSEKDTEFREKEVPEEKPAKEEELKETLKEETTALEKKEEVAKQEDVEPVQVAKIMQ